MQKANAAAEKRCGSYVMMMRSSRKRSSFFFLSGKVEKNMMADADMAGELQGLHAGEERRRSNASQTGDSCLEVLWQQIAAVCAAVGPNQIDTLADAVVQRFNESGAVQEQVPGRDERRRNSEEDQEQGQQVALPTPGGFVQGAPASSLERDLLLVRVYLVKADDDLGGLVP